MSGDGRPDAFLPGWDVPMRADVMADAALGQTGRELADALFDRDTVRAGRLIDRDPLLLRPPADAIASPLEIAIATADLALIQFVVDRGAPLDGVANDGRPLAFALYARDSHVSHLLLRAGANPAPPNRLLAPMRSTIILNWLEGVAMLIEFGAKPDMQDEYCRRPLHVALDMERFRIAELLIDKGADLWAIDSTGANLGGAVTSEMRMPDPEERAAQLRLSHRALAAGWPDPVLTPQAIRDAALAGDWPPAAARAAGAPPVDPRTLAVIAKRASRDATIN